MHKWDHLNAAWLLKSQHLDSIWDKVPVISISVDPTGNPWVLDGFGNIFRYDTSSWIKEGSQDGGIKIANGIDGSVYTLSVYGEVKSVLLSEKILLANAVQLPILAS